MFGYRTAHFGRQSTTHASRFARLAVEKLEDRRLLAVDLTTFAAPMGPMVEAEGEGSCAPFAQIEEIRMAATTPRTIEIAFQGNMEIDAMISDGSIVDAVQLVDFHAGPLALAASQFTFDTEHQTLRVTLPDGQLADYLELRLDGAEFTSCGGSYLQGGVSGLSFAEPMFAASELASGGGDGGGTTVQTDYYSVPSQADWNSDGLPDLIVGQKTDGGEGKVQVYLNDGTLGAPSFADPFFVQSEGSDLAVAASGCLGAFPRLVDWDGDGLQDLIVGLADGSVQVFYNTNSAAEPLFGAPQPIAVGPADAKSPIDVGSRATPVPVDWNNDGRIDLLVGAMDGKVQLYLNESVSGAPDLQSELVIQDGSQDLIVVGDRSSPAVFDLDGDGRKDLLSGNTAGEVIYYANVGTDSEPVFEGATKLEAAGILIDLEGTPRSRPFVSDWNGDSIPDLLVGAEDGYVRVYRGEAWSSPVLHPGTAGSAGEIYSHTFTTLDHPWHNAQQPSDANGNGSVDTDDIDQLFAELNERHYHAPTGAFDHWPLLPFYCDVNDDSLFTPRDILLAISQIAGGTGGGEGEGEWDSDSEIMGPASPRATIGDQAIASASSGSGEEDSHRSPAPQSRNQDREINHEETKNTKHRRLRASLLQDLTETRRHGETEKELSLEGFAF